MHVPSIRPAGRRAASRRGVHACRPAIDLRSTKRFRGVSSRLLRQAARTLLCEGIGFSHAELSLALLDDEGMQALNARWRGKERPTDVLSFPLQPPLVAACAPDGGAALPLGDIVLCVPQAARQAGARGHSLQEELYVLLTHGLLHLLGHDHVHGGRQAARMRREEQRLLALLSPPGALLRCLLASSGGS